MLRCRLTQSNEDPLEEKVSVRNELDNHCLVDKPRGKDKKITNSSANSFQNKLYRFKSTLKSLLWVKLRKHDILHLPYYKSIVCHRSPPCRKFQLLSKPTPPVFNAGFLFHDPRERLRHHLGFFVLNFGNSSRATDDMIQQFWTLCVKSVKLLFKSFWVN